MGKDVARGLPRAPGVGGLHPRACCPWQAKTEHSRQSRTLRCGTGTAAVSDGIALTSHGYGAWSLVGCLLARHAMHSAVLIALRPPPLGDLQALVGGETARQTNTGEVRELRREMRDM